MKHFFRHPGRLLGLAALMVIGDAHAQWTFQGNTTPTWEEAVASFKALADEHRTAHWSVLGADDNGLPIHLLVLSDGTTPVPDSIRAAGKRILWITNGIHAGEPDGIDASLLLVKALLNSDQYMGLLASTAVCIVPVYNVSGALKRNSTTRANQVGPEAYGFRANARNLDLNRDFVKVDARNTRDLLAALHRWDPDVYFETHVSNGADHQYVMELLTTHPDRLDAALRTYLEGTLKPGLYAWMERRSVPMCPYFETVKDHPGQGLAGFLDGPRYSSGHAGLCQRIGILSETHMLKPYAERVNATFQLMLATLAVLDQHGDALRQAREQAKGRTAQARSFGFNHVLDTTRIEQLPWKGFQEGYKPSKVSGQQRLYYDRDRPIETHVPWMDHFVPALTIEKPKGYLVPQAWRAVIERLKLDGVPMEVLEQRTAIDAEVLRIARYGTVSTPFEGHYLHHDIVTEKSWERVTALPGDVVVPMGHPTDRLVMEILEPRASDSFFCWGFFDSILQQKEWFSAYVFEDIAAGLLEKDPALRKELEAAKAADPELARDAWEQLYWVYQRSPHMESGVGRFPVARILQ